MRPRPDRNYQLDVLLDFSSGLDVATELLVLVLEELEDLAVRGQLLAHGPLLPGVDLGLLGVLVGHVLPSRLVLQKILREKFCRKNNRVVQIPPAKDDL